MSISTIIIPFPLYACQNEAFLVLECIDRCNFDYEEQSLMEKYYSFSLHVHGLSS
jgi:hypothetical protein